jgi:hypothetical protein
MDAHGFLPAPAVPDWYLSEDPATWSPVAPSKKAL